MNVKLTRIFDSFMTHYLSELPNFVTFFTNLILTKQ